MSSRLLFIRIASSLSTPRLEMTHVGDASCWGLVRSLELDIYSVTDMTGKLHLQVCMYRCAMYRLDCPMYGLDVQCTDWTFSIESETLRKSERNVNQ